MDTLDGSGRIAHGGERGHGKPALAGMMVTEDVAETVIVRAHPPTFPPDPRGRPASGHGIFVGVSGR